MAVSVIADDPAEKAGLQGSEQQVEIDGRQALLGGDVIVSIDDEKITDLQVF